MGYGYNRFANQSVDSKDFYNIEADDGSNYCFVKAVILDKDEKYPENLGTTLQAYEDKGQVRDYMLLIAIFIHIMS